MNIYALIVTTVYLINIVVVAGMVFFKEKDVKSTMGWIFIFMLLPFVGYIVYFLIGSTTKFKILSRKYSLKKLEEGYNQVLLQNIENIETGKLDEKINPDFADMIKFNAKNGGCVYSSDNNVELFTSAKDKYERMFAEIENARESINVLYFIIKTKDDIGKKFISLLAKKAREGVEVRLIYDRLGMMKNRRRDFKELTDAGGMVYAFLPSVLGSLIQANYRMHRKIVVIDGRVAYTGGINIGDDYLGLDPRVHPWRDSAVRITGSAVQAVQLRFLSDWEYLDKQAGSWRAYPSKVDNIAHMKKYFRLPEQTGNMGVQIISSGPDSNNAPIRDAYLKILSSAKDYVYIETPYLAPDETLLSAFRMAARSGVDVRIIIPGVPDKRFVYYGTMSHIDELLNYGIKVYIHEGFIHSKMIVADDFVSAVGSANFDMRSFLINFEMTALVYDDAFADQCKNAYFEDLTHSKEINVKEFNARSRIKKMKEAAWRLLTPFI